MFEIVSLLSICLVVVLLCNCVFNLCSHFCNCDEKVKENSQDVKDDIDIPIVVVNPNGNIHLGMILDEG